MLNETLCILTHEVVHFNKVILKFNIAQSWADNLEYLSKEKVLKAKAC